MARLFKRDGDTPKRSLWQKVKDLARTDFGVLLRGGVDPGSLEALETMLLEADFGVPTTLKLVEEVERLAKRGEIKTEDEFREALRVGIREALSAGHGAPRDRRERRRQDHVYRQAGHSFAR